MESAGGPSTKRKATQPKEPLPGASTRSSNTSRRQKQLEEQKETSQEWPSTTAGDSGQELCSTDVTSLVEALLGLTKSVDLLREHLGGDDYVPSDSEAEEDKEEEEDEEEQPKPARKYSGHPSGWFLSEPTASGSRPTLWGGGQRGTQQEMED